MRLMMCRVIPRLHSLIQMVSVLDSLWLTGANGRNGGVFAVKASQTADAVFSRDCFPE